MTHFACRKRCRALGRLVRQLHVFNEDCYDYGFTGLASPVLLIKQPTQNSDWDKLLLDLATLVPLILGVRLEDPFGGPLLCNHCHCFFTGNACLVEHLRLYYSDHSLLVRPRSPPFANTATTSPWEPMRIVGRLAYLGLVSKYPFLALIALAIK